VEGGLPGHGAVPEKIGSRRCCTAPRLPAYDSPINNELRIDYNGGLRTLTEGSYATVVDVIRDEMPHAWLARYQKMCEGPTNVLVVSVSGFDYLYDYCTDLIDRGELPAGAREDRAVAAFGLSRPPKRARDATRIKRFPASDNRGDRGHFLSHAAGGPLDINLFHQDVRLNRGWSPEGKLYREMERYCAAHEGTFFFSRPIYVDNTARPSEIELGILLPALTFWVEAFQNPGVDAQP
jgi:hypothetical protein